VDDVRGAAAAIRAARVLLVQLEAPLECVLEAARIAREAGAPIVLDPAPAIPLPDELLRLVSVVRPNAREAGVLTGVEVRDVATAREAAWSLLARGVGAIVVQAGEEGNLLVDREGELFLPELAVHTVDSTGAGDALAAALATLIAEGRPLSVAARFANAAAAHATTVLGAQAGLPRRSDVEALLARAPAP
jgi:ribokinase